MGELKMAPVHRGEILLKDFMKPLGISQYRLTKAAPGTNLAHSLIAVNGSAPDD
jgi:plasmid maintenance system antidote protein VapI